MKKRYYFWDNYKGILIFLVVLGHYMFNYSLKLGPESFADILNTFVHIFHMPAFVLCSGYLSKSANSRSKSAVAKLVLYYIIFNGIMFAYKFIVDGASGKLLTPHQTVWYLLSLIVWRIVIDDLAKIKFIVPITVATTLFCGFWSELGTDVLSIRRTVAFFIFFLIGYKLDREKVDSFIENRTKKTFALGWTYAAALSAALLYIVIKYNECFPIASSLTYDTYNDAHNIYTRIFYMAAAFLIIIAMFMIIPNKKLPVLTKWGKNSLTIFVCHRIITLLFDKAFPYKEFQTIWYLYIFAAAIVTCFMLSSDRLTAFISNGVTKATNRMLDENDEVGNVMKTVLMVVIAVVMAVVPYINSIR